MLVRIQCFQHLKSKNDEIPMRDIVGEVGANKDFLFGSYMHGDVCISVNLIYAVTNEYFSISVAER